MLFVPQTLSYEFVPQTLSYENVRVWLQMILLH
jgi:hypothetical protein